MVVTARALALVGCTLLTLGCLTGSAAQAVPPHELWREWMLAGYFGVWRGGREAQPRYPLQAKIHSWPEGAAGTTYGIEVDGSDDRGTGEWLSGGLLGREGIGDWTVELFGHDVVSVRQHTFFYDKLAYEFFVVLRPARGGLGKLLRHWRFPPEELARTYTGDPIDPAIFRRSTRARRVIESMLDPTPGPIPEPFAEGYVDVDPVTKTVIVTIIGLKRPFAERIDLSQHLRE